MEERTELKIGDVVLVQAGGWGLLDEDVGKYVEVVGDGDYYRGGVKIAPFQCELETEIKKNGCVIGIPSFGEKPMILLNTKSGEAGNKPPEGAPLETRKVGKVKMELVETGFPYSMLALGQLMTWAFENKDYLPNDWKQLPTETFLAAAARHRNARLRGEELDESGMPHLVSEAFNVLAQLELYCER
jgi:hypothetical protein